MYSDKKDELIRLIRNAEFAISYSIPKYYPRAERSPGLEHGRIGQVATAVIAPEAGRSFAPNSSTWRVLCGLLLLTA